MFTSVPSPLFLGLCTLSLTASGLAQSSAVVGAHGLWLDGGRAAAVGVDYKASFDGSEFCWTPVLGAAAPRNVELRLGYRAVRRDGRVLHTRTERSPAPHADGNRVRFARGEQVIEVWEAGARHVALSYEFVSRPVGAGDLVVDLALTGDFGGRTSTPMPDGGVRLHGPDGTAVRIGAVTGIGARGRTAAGTVRVADGRVELVLPAAFVDLCAYPMVLDPTIGSDSPIGGVGTEALPAVAFDAAQSVYLVVWQRAFSATDIDIYGQRVDRDGRLLGAAFPIAAPTTGIAKEPAVGMQFHSSCDTFIVAWSQAPGLFAASDVYGATVPTAVGPASPSAPLVASSARSEVRPRLAGSADPNSCAVLTWTEEGIGVRGVRLASLSPTVPPVVVPPFLLTQTRGHEGAVAADGEPGFPGVTICSDLDDNGSPGPVGSVYTYDTVGNLVATMSLGDHGFVAANFAVARHGTTHLLVYDVAETTGTSRDVYAQKIVVDRTLTIRSVGSPTPIAVTPGRDEFAPAVAFLGTKFAIGWSAADPNTTGAYDLVVRTVDPDTCVPCGRDEVIGSGGRPFDGSPAIASEHTGGAAPDRALIAFGSGDVLPPFTSEVRIQLFEAIGAGGRVVSVGGGCGRGGSARLDGPFALGNRDLHVLLGGADRTATRTFLAIGLPGPGLPCGPCTVTSSFTLLPGSISGGAARVAFPVPCLTELLGGTLELQWWTLGTSSTPCPLVPGLALSDRILVTLGE